MISIPSFAPLAQAFGFTIAHSLWQIALIWLIFKLLEWRFNRRHQLVYLLSLTAMLVAVLWAMATFAVEWARFKPVETAFYTGENMEPIVNSAVVPTSIAMAFNLWDATQIWLENHAAQIGWIWAVCAGLLWLRLIGGWWLAQRLRQRHVSAASTAFQECCNYWANSLQINTKIQLLESPHISEPLTLGFWKPVVLFPVGMLLQLSPAQVEALLLHELAHIRRHDYLVNLFQLVLEVCFFYHPLFWLLSREARSRREFCCDQVVMRHTSDPILYAKTLTDLQLSSLQPSTQFVMNATGKSRFTERILHIAGISPKRSARPNWLIVLLLPALVALCSWEPALSKVSDTVTPMLEAVVATDSLPPQKSMGSGSKIARPQESANPKPAEGKALSDRPVKTDAMPANDYGVALEVVKMNVLYTGVDNPLRIAATGVPASEIRVKLLGEGTVDGGNGNYIVRVVKTGEVVVRVMRQVGNDLITVADHKYRVKRIPDPAVRLDWKYRSGVLSPETMQQSKGIRPVLENFDFEAVCEVVGFEATYIPMSEDAIAKPNAGADWNTVISEWVKKAKPGDAFFFDDILVKCPGDAEPRNLGGLAFKIKAQ